MPEDTLSKLLYDDLVLMSETSEVLKNMFLKWKAFGSKGLKVDLDKTKVSGSITNNGMLKRKLTFAGYSTRVNSNSVLCVLCGK